MGINSEFGVSIAGDEILVQDRPFTLSLIRSEYGFSNPGEAEAALEVFTKAAEALKRIKGAITPDPQM